MLGHFTLGRSYPMRERLAIAAGGGRRRCRAVHGRISSAARRRGSATTSWRRSARRARVAARRPRPDQPAPRDDDATPVRSERFVAPRRSSSPIASDVATSRRSRRTSSPGAAGLDETDRRARSGSPTRWLRYGVEVGLEYTGFHDGQHARRGSSPSSTACGRPNVGVCVDVWHHTRSRSAVPLAPSVRGADDPLRPVERRPAGARSIPTTRPTACATGSLPGDRRDGRGRLRRPAHRDGRRRAVDGRGVP